MPARGSLYQLLDRDRELGARGVEAVYHANTVDAPTEKCFIILKFEQQAQAFARRGPDRVTVWVHDKESQDYGRIDRCLERVKDLLGDAVHLAGPDGWVLTQADWTADGPDLVDNGYDSITRWSEFRAVSRYPTA